MRDRPSRGLQRTSNYDKHVAEKNTHAPAKRHSDDGHRKRADSSCEGVRRGNHGNNIGAGRILDCQLVVVSLPDYSLPWRPKMASSPGFLPGHLHHNHTCRKTTVVSAVTRSRVTHNSTAQGEHPFDGAPSNLRLELRLHGSVVWDNHASNLSNV